MQRSDGPAFFTGMTKLCGLYEKNLSKDVLGTYWKHLKSWKIEAVLAAFEGCVDRCKFMPRVADILEELRQESGPAYHQQFEALPEPPVDPESTRKGLLLCGFASVAFKMGLQPETPEWDKEWADYQDRSKDERAKLKRKVRMNKENSFTSIADVMAGLSLGRKA